MTLSIYNGREKKTDSYSDITTLPLLSNTLVIMQGRRFCYPCNPNLLLEHRLFQETIPLSIQICKKIQSIFDFNFTHLSIVSSVITNVLEIAFRELEDEDQRALILQKVINPYLEKLIEIHKNNMQLLGVSSSKEYHLKIKQLEGFENDALKQYWTDSSNIQKRCVIDLILLKDYCKNENQEGSQVVTDFWSLIERDPSALRRWKKIQLLANRYLFEITIESVTTQAKQYINEKNLNGDIQNALEEQFKKNAHETFKLLKKTYKSEKSQKILNYVILVEQLTMPSILKKDMVHLLDSELVKAINDLSPDLMSQMSTLNPFDYKVLKLLEADQSSLDIQSGDFLALSEEAREILIKTENPIEYFLKRLIEKDDRKCEILNIVKDTLESAEEEEMDPFDEEEEIEYTE